VVEDDPDFADAVRFDLESGGYHVDITSSVTEALRRMRDGSDLDLVITDVRLSCKSGIQLLFADDGGATPPPVLMMSALVSPKLRRLVEGRGGSVLEKPFSFASLHATVIRALRRAAREKGRKRRAGGLH
jgi:two-component system OmpR family response regulator